MLRVAQWEMALAMAFLLSVWTTALLLPNSMMPASVAQTHLWETLGFSLVFGALAGWLLPPPHLAVRASAPPPPDEAVPEEFEVAWRLDR